MPRAPWRRQLPTFFSQATGSSSRLLRTEAGSAGSESSSELPDTRPRVKAPQNAPLGEPAYWTFRLFPTSRKGAGSCFSLGLRPATSLSQRRRAARLSPLRRRPQPSRPSHLPLFLRLRRLRQVFRRVWCLHSRQLGVSCELTGP